MSEKRVVAGLWAVPGLGPKTVERLREKFVPFEHLADCLIGEWCDEPGVELPTHAARCIPKGRTLGQLGDELLEAAKQQQMKIAWRGEPAYPDRLAEIVDAPPMLFYRGPGTTAPARRRIAMVGTRDPDSLSLTELVPLIQQVAHVGIGVVSGGAFGIDTVAHVNAAKVGGETWAFVGSALDQLDDHQQKLWDSVAPAGATFWSELPPGVRAARKTFPRRNRLISGASDAVAILRAGMRSGTRYTGRYACLQRRPLLAYPGAGRDPRAALCNLLIKHGVAKLFTSAEDIMRAVGFSGYPSHRPAPVLQATTEVCRLSADAQRAYGVITKAGRCFDELIEELGMQSAQLLVALSELVGSGHVVEHTGRKYQRV